MTIGVKYLVDKKGKKKAVLIDMNEYSRLLARMEELEDALDLDKAVRLAPDFRSYSEIRKELIKEGRL
jgi:hypothetical protein